jgi:hypothetical protein
LPQFQHLGRFKEHIGKRGADGPSLVTHDRYVTPPLTADFIGASGYASTDLNVVATSHEVSAATVNFEFLSFGM